MWAYDRFPPVNFQAESQKRGGILAAPLTRRPPRLTVFVDGNNFGQRAPFNSAPPWPSFFGIFDIEKSFQHFGYDVEFSSVQLSGQQLVAAASLVKSLGGGWQTQN
jgi:hypothetical protein